MITETYVKSWFVEWCMEHVPDPTEREQLRAFAENKIGWATFVKSATEVCHHDWQVLLLRATDETELHNLGARLWKEMVDRMRRAWEAGPKAADGR